MHQEACNPCNTVDAGVMEQSIKQSSDNARQTNTLLEPQLGVIWAPKASRKLTETSSFPGPEDREHSVCNHLQKRWQNQAAHQRTRCRGKNELQPPVGCWGCQPEAFLSHPPAVGLSWDWSHTAPEKLRAAWLPPHHWCNRVPHLLSSFSTDFTPLVLGSSPDGVSGCPATAWAVTDLLPSVIFPTWQQNKQL